MFSESNLIVPTAARPNRKTRLAQKALARAQGGFPNVQARQQTLLQATGCGVGMSPIGPMAVINLTDGRQIPLPVTPDQAKQLGVALISAAAHFELLKKMHADQQPDTDPVAVSPDAEALLAESQAKTAGQSGPMINGYPSIYTDAMPPAALKTDYDEDDDDEYDEGLNDPIDFAAGPAPNSFDVNGRPVYEPPAE